MPEPAPPVVQLPSPPAIPEPAPPVVQLPSPPPPEPRPRPVVQLPSPPQPEPRPRPRPEEANTALSSPPARFEPAEYKRLTARQLAKLVKHAAGHVGERVVLYGRVSELAENTEVESFVGECAATREWLDEDDPGWQAVVRYWAGSGYCWHPGVWHDELRPAAEQFADLAPGDVFQAFVQVAADGTNEPDVVSEGEPPTVMVERIQVFAVGPD